MNYVALIKRDILSPIDDKRKKNTVRLFLQNGLILLRFASEDNYRKMKYYLPVCLPNASARKTVGFIVV